jgi:hypothetical protein
MRGRSARHVSKDAGARERQEEDLASVVEGDAARQHEATQAAIGYAQPKGTARVGLQTKTGRSHGDTGRAE